MKTLIGLKAEELCEIATSLGEPAFRGKQIARWVYRDTAAEIDQMTDLPAGFRSRLAGEYAVGIPATAHRDEASDGTVKYLFQFGDGERVESVYLPYPDRVS